MVGKNATFFYFFYFPFLEKWDALRIDDGQELKYSNLYLYIVVSYYLILHLIGWTGENQKWIQSLHRIDNDKTHDIAQSTVIPRIYFTYLTHRGLVSA